MYHSMAKQYSSARKNLPDISDDLIVWQKLVLRNIKYNPEVNSFSVDRVYTPKQAIPFMTNKYQSNIYVLSKPVVRFQLTIMTLFNG